MAQAIGRRERKKAATRSALCQAAMRLALERGVENVTLEAIAREADVAPRTFHNYFASKEDAIVAELFEFPARYPDALEARPDGEPVWEALQSVVVTELSVSPEVLEDLSGRMRMIKASRSLAAPLQASLEQMSKALAAVVAIRTGTDVERDLYPGLVAASAIVATNAAVDLWLADGGRANLADLAAEAFTQLRAGLPEPTPGRV